jgi:hypothetical protein
VEDSSTPKNKKKNKKSTNNVNSDSNKNFISNNKRNEKYRYKIIAGSTDMKRSSDSNESL